MKKLLSWLLVLIYFETTDAKENRGKNLVVHVDILKSFLSR